MHTGRGTTSVPHHHHSQSWVRESVSYAWRYSGCTKRNCSCNERHPCHKECQAYIPHVVMPLLLCLVITLFSTSLRKLALSKQSLSAHSASPLVTDDRVIHSALPQVTDDRVTYSALSLVTDDRVIHSALSLVTDDRAIHSALPQVTDDRVIHSALSLVTDDRVIHSALPQVTDDRVTHSALSLVTDDRVIHSALPQVTDESNT